jgi:hypothetical protein
MIMQSVRLALFCALTLTVSVGCGDDETGSGGSGGGGTTGAISQADVVAAFDTFTSSGFTQVSVGDVPSQHALADTVAVWVQGGYVNEYMTIDPADQATAYGPAAVGTIIVKQHYTGGAADGSALVMAKFESGFNAAAGDWWWGRFNTSGDLTSDAGVVDFCIACHEPQFEAHDYLAGLDAANK